MGDDPIFSAPIEPVHSSQARQQEVRHQNLNRIIMNQVASSESMNEFIEYAAFNPLAMTRKFETLAQKRNAPTAPSSNSRKEENKLESAARDAQRKNIELKAEVLVILRKQVTEADTKESILQKTLSMYSDQWLSDEALDFLLLTTEGDLQETVQQAKEELNARYGKEIRAGRNTAMSAREFGKQGLGNPQALRDIYRDIVGNPREASTLFDEFTSVFSFDNIEIAIEFLLHALGSDLKAKGSSISKEELQRLFSEARTMQAILQLFRFFLARMKVIQHRFQKAKLPLPPELTFDKLAKLFIKLLEDRYPSSDKVLLLSLALDLSEQEAAQIIVFTQFRDATRHISPKFYKSEQHRQEILRSILDALSDLEDRLDEKEEEEE